MEKQTWKVGNHPSIVVSDTKTKNTNFPVPPNKEESTDDEVEHYGGYFICESIGNIETAKLIAAAPDLLSASQALINDTAFRYILAMFYSEDRTSNSEFIKKVTALQTAIEKATNDVQNT